MPFDDYPHRAAPMLRPVVGHPDAAASADLLSTALAGAYGFALSSSRCLGTLLYRSPFDAVGEPPIVRSASPIGVARVEGYVPTWASALVAEVLIVRTDNQEDAEGRIQLVTSADTGSVEAVPLELAEDPRPGQPDSYPINRIRGELVLSSTTLDTDVTVDVRACFLASGAGPVACYPRAVSVWWR